ncbi:hypothetical protein SAMN02746069_00336, partial [Legionella israelensis DSM 19235]
MAILESPLLDKGVYTRLRIDTAVDAAVIRGVVFSKAIFPSN